MYEKLKLHDLRYIASKKGVRAPTKLCINDLIEQIEKIDRGEILPYYSNKGRPRKPSIMTLFE